MVRIPLTKSQAGISLIELVGATVIFTIALIGALNHLVIIRALAYHNQLKSAVATTLNDTLLAHQNDNNGTILVSVSAELAPYVPAGAVTLVKTSTNLTGTLIWTSVLTTNSSMTFTSTASLTLIPSL